MTYRINQFPADRADLYEAVGTTGLVKYTSTVPSQQSIIRLGVRFNGTEYLSEYRSNRCVYPDASANEILDDINYVIRTSSAQRTTVETTETNNLAIVGLSICVVNEPQSSWSSQGDVYTPPVPPYEAPLSCSLGLPAQIDLGVNPIDGTTDITGYIRCDGKGSGAAILTVEGSATVTPTPGLVLSMRTDSHTVEINGGETRPIVASVSVSNRDVNPGPYSASFVIKLNVH
jgi:hypothetical protein